MHVCIRFNTISIYTIYRLKNYSETKKDSSETKKDSSETKNYSETKKQFFGLVIYMSYTTYGVYMSKHGLSTLPEMLPLCIYIYMP